MPLFSSPLRYPSTAEIDDATIQRRTVDILLSEHEWAAVGSVYEAVWTSVVGEPEDGDSEVSVFEFTIIESAELPQVTLKLAPFVAKIDRVEDNRHHININWENFKAKLTYQESNSRNLQPTQKFSNWGISYKINDNDNRIKFFIGLAHKDLEEYTEAAKFFKKILKINPEDINAQFQLGICYFRLDKKRESKKILNSLYMLDRNLYDSLDRYINTPTSNY